MQSTGIAEDVNNVSTTHGRNGYTREEWLHAVLWSGEVTRIGQHLALVIYHLSDPQTNTAKQSARDLERITGWTKTAIMDHLSELEIFIRIKFGRGSAKHLFELQGVITEAVDEVRSVRQTAMPSGSHAATTSQPAAIVATDVAIKISGRQTATDAAANTAVATKAAATLPQNAKNSNEGGTIGGERITNVVPYNLSLESAREEAPLWTIEEDGSFNGQVFEISPTAMTAIRSAYTFLEIPAHLIAADQFLAGEFRKNPQYPTREQRFARLHQYLVKQNEKFAVLAKQVLGVAAQKPRGHVDCHFDGHRLVVANGFKGELLGIAKGSDIRLETTINKIVSKVSTALRGDDLKRVVLGEFSKQVEWDDRDERKTAAIENRGKPGADGAKPQSVVDQSKALDDKEWLADLGARYGN